MDKACWTGAFELRSHFCGWKRSSKRMYKSGSWIQSKTWKPQGYTPFLPSPLWPCGFSPSGQWGFSSPHVDITGMNVLQVVKWSRCQEIGDPTVPAIMEGCSASCLCPPASTPTLAAQTPRVCKLQAWTSFPYFHSKSQALSCGQQNLAEKRGKLNSKRENLLYQGLFSWGCNFWCIQHIFWVICSPGATFKRVERKVFYLQKNNSSNKLRGSCQSLTK